MVLSAQEESLISVVRTLPPDEAGKILNWARQLADLAAGRMIEHLKNLPGGMIGCTAHNTQCTLADGRDHNVIVEYLCHPMLVSQTL